MNIERTILLARASLAIKYRARWNFGEAPKPSWYAERVAHWLIRSATQR